MRAGRSGGPTKAEARWYDDDDMMARTQITFEPELARRARQRASSLGISLPEYVRRLVERDLRSMQAEADPAAVFNLGRSKGSNVAADKHAMIAEAFAATHKDTRRR